MKNHRSLLMLLCAAALASACDKNAVQDITAPPPGSARVKFFNFGVGSPGVNFYANDTKMTAINSATGQESTIGVNYGGAAAGGFYSAITPGQYTLTGRIAGAIDKDLAISSLPVAIADGKAYSFYQSGVYDATTKTVDSFIVEDTYPEEIDWSRAYVRFVNGIFNADPMTLHAFHTGLQAESAVGGAVAYKSAGAFTALPGGVYDLRTRYAGSDTNVITRTGVAFAPGKVYTIGARGDITVTSTILLDNTANR